MALFARVSFSGSFGASLTRDFSETSIRITRATGSRARDLHQQRLRRPRLGPRKRGACFRPIPNAKDGAVHPRAGPGASSYVHSKPQGVHSVPPDMTASACDAWARAAQSSVGSSGLGHTLQGCLRPRRHLSAGLHSAVCWESGSS